MFGRVCRDYGDYLVSKKYFEEAGIMYSRGGCTDQAVDAYYKYVLLLPNQPKTS